jgi:hypothetical protein
MVRAADVTRRPRRIDVSAVGMLQRRTTTPTSLEVLLVLGTAASIGLHGAMSIP